MKVLFLPEVREYLNEVSHIMYEKDYFGFIESSEKYMDELINDIIATLPNRQKKVAPPYFERYGKKILYSLFRKNKTTQWYVFFSVYDNGKEVVYLVRHVSNNHVIAQFL